MWNRRLQNQTEKVPCIVLLNYLHTFVFNILSVFNSRHFLGIVSLVFPEIWHGARIPCEVVVRNRAGFSRKIFFPKKLGKWAKNRPKTGFFKFIGKFGHKFLLNSIYNENLYYLLCSCTNSIFGKIFVPEIWAKMFSASQIAGFFNQLYLQNKSMK